MAEVLDAAARAGFPDPDRLWHMSPAGIERMLTAHAVRMEQDDRRAWMAGYYCAIAFHAPRRFPRNPHLIRQSHKTMTEKEMQRVLLDFAAERSSYDVGNAQDRISGRDGQP